MNTWYPGSGVVTTLEEYMKNNKSEGVNVITTNDETVWFEPCVKGVYLDGVLTSDELRLIADYLDKKKEK
jgi:hypothetical protein